MGIVSDRFSQMRDKAMRVFMAGVLAVGMMPLPAYANGLQAGATAFDDEVTTQSQTVGTHVIGTAFAAAEAAPEILGLDNPEARESDKANGYEHGKMFIEIFGTNKNDVADPFLVNEYNSEEPGISFHKARGGSGGGPNQALGAYSTDANPSSDQEIINKIWEYYPDVVIGTGLGGDASANPNAYDASAQAVATAKNKTYSTVAVNYNYTAVEDMVKIMYAIASAGDQAATATTGTAASRTLRYGSAMDIAKNYERYTIGTKGYVLEKIEEGAVEMRTVASVESYDQGAGTFKLRKFNVAEKTAKENRYLDAVHGVVVNYGEDHGTATLQELKDNVDVILVGGQVGDAAGCYAALDAEAKVKAYWSGYENNKSTGATFPLTANSIENAQNVGRILSCVYPEILSQSDMVAYYYDNFYHVAENNVPELMAQFMGQTRNWNLTNSSQALDTWATTDVTSGWNTRVQNIIEEGTGYLNQQKNADEKTENFTNAGSLVTPTDNVASDTMSFKNATVTAADAAYTGSAVSPTGVTVKFGATTINNVEQDTTNFTVTSSNNTNAGAATVTVEVKSGNNLSLTPGDEASGTFNIKYDLADAVVNNATTENYSGNAIVPAVTVKSQSITADTDYSVAITGFTDPAGTAATTLPTEIKDAGTYKLKLTAVSDMCMNSKEDVTFTVNPLDVSSTWTVEDIQSQRATGSAIEPEVTVKASSAADAATIDPSNYDVSYGSNTNAGTATATVTPKGNYTGTLTKNFVIFKVAEAGDADSSVDGAYDELAVTLTGSETGVKLEVEDKTDSASSDAQAAKVDGAESFKVFDVTLETVDSSGNKVKELTGESGATFGKISLTFDLGADNAGKLAIVKQIHAKDASNKETIEHGAKTVGADGKITISGIDKLSEFVISMQTQYTVTFAANGGSTVQAQTVAKDAQIATAPTTTRANYKFDGWFDGNTKVEFPYTVTKDVTLTAHWTSTGVTMWRLYNPNSGEHFYTSSDAERANLVKVGWSDEAKGWTAPSAGDPVYRLYNPNEPLGDHHYTTSKAEYDRLCQIGWKGEGIGWYSDQSKGVGLHRLYNPNAYPSGKTGAHHYTTSASEKDYLVSIGWQYENYGWYGMK